MNQNTVTIHDLTSNNYSFSMSPIRTQLFNKKNYNWLKTNQLNDDMSCSVRNNANSLDQLFYTKHRPNGTSICIESMVTQS